MSCSRNENKWEDYFPKFIISVWHFFVLSFYANEQNLGLSKTLETLRRKSNLEEKILDPNLSFVKRVLCSTVNGEKIKA